jgi:hypothetical protein
VFGTVPNNEPKAEIDWCFLYGKERTMKFTFKLLAALVFLSVTFRPQIGAAADANRFQGHNADAYFFTTDASDCIQTSVIIETGEDVLLSIQLIRYNICQNETLLEAFGRKELTKSELNYHGNLDAATLHTTVTLFDYVTNSTLDVTIDLTWTGTGEIHKTSFHSHGSPSPSCHSNLLIQEAYRSASVVGTISDGTTNFTPEPADQANLYFARRTAPSPGCD